jgi:hypothetical protein
MLTRRRAGTIDSIVASFFIGGPVNSGRRSSFARAVCAVTAVLLAVGCAAGSRALPVTAVASSESRADATAPGPISAISIEPVVPGYVRGDATALRIWGSAAGQVTVRALDGAGNPIAGAGAPAIAIVSKNATRLTASAAKNARYGRFTLQAIAATDPKSACPTCRVVAPGTVALEITVTPQGGKAKRFTVRVTISHKIVAVSLNPLPNPSLGGTDAVLQYFDDNTKPSVIWDDMYVRNATSFPNVTGLAFGADGSFYVANSGLLSGAQGTVTKYAPGSTAPTPVKTFATASLRSAAAVALDAKDNVYVADNGYETVTRFPKRGPAVTITKAWEAGADVNGVAVDAAHGYLYVAMTGAGDFYPPSTVYAGRIVVLPLNFGSATAPLHEIDSSGTSAVNQPYGVAVGTAGQLYVVNDYVSIVNQPPGPGPEFSTLTRYDQGIASASALPDASTNASLVWPLSVATDAAGTVYVANSTPPSASGKPGKLFLREYTGSFASGARGQSSVDLSPGMPAAYGPYYFNIEGVAVDPSPLRT